MLDPYNVLGIASGADEETIKKAYRQKCKQYHPDLHPNDPECEDKFKEVQAAYSEIMRQRSGGGSPAGASGGYSGYGGYSSQSSGYRQQNQQQQDPFGFGGFGGFGFDPFGFGFYGSSGGDRADSRDTPEMQAANNYIRSRHYSEAMNVLNSVPENERNARWHYYSALANSGLGNNIRARSEARAAVDMEPGNYEYQNLLDRLQNPGSAYTTSQQQHTQPGSNMGGGICRFCVTMWIAQLICNCCCCGRGGYGFI